MKGWSGLDNKLHASFVSPNLLELKKKIYSGQKRKVFKDLRYTYKKTTQTPGRKPSSPKSQQNQDFVWEKCWELPIKLETLETKSFTKSGKWFLQRPKKLFLSCQIHAWRKSKHLCSCPPNLDFFQHLSSSPILIPTTFMQFHPSP